MIHLKFYQGGIYLLSILISLAFALVIFTLRRNARILLEKKWATPFANTFFVLAGIYFLLFFNLLIKEHLHGGKWELLASLVTVIVYICSGVTNYLFLLSAFRLAEPTLDKQRLSVFTKWLIGQAYVRRSSLGLLLLAGFIQIGAETQFAGKWASGWFNVPDALFSALALISMGVVLYQNISYRHDGFMARVALLSSIGYVLVYVLYALDGIPYFIRSLSHGEVNDASDLADLSISFISLLLKFGLFFPGYSLMLLISSPLAGIERLLRDVTRKQKEYLESDGIVRAICKELQLNSVQLSIKLPGLNENQIALYAYPSSTNGNNQQPQKSAYKAGTDYDHVMTSGEPYPRYHNDNLYPFIQRMSKITVPVFFHNSVIACLEAEIGEERFTEADRSNFERIATLISPAVQAYRETAALNKISQDLARLQIGIAEYNMERDVRRITEIIHDVASPLATGVSIEIGFLEYRGIHAQDEHFGELIEEQLNAELSGEDITDYSENHRWLKKRLQIPMVDLAGQKVGEQVLGRFVFVTDKGGKRNGYPTLGTTPMYRRVVSDLLTDTLLDFIRGYLNELLDKLGVQLSGPKGTNVDHWFNEVEQKTREARLLWAVASYPEGANLLGKDEMIAIVNKLESPEQKERWKLKRGSFSLYSLDQPEAGTYHVIKKELKDTQATLWLGVSRQGFGRELDYVSPWQYFLDHFCEIADSALRRILDLEKRKKDLAEAQSIATAMMTTGNIIHQLVSLARDLTSTSEALGDAIKKNRLRGNEHHKKLIASFPDTCDKLDDLLKMLTGVFVPDERRPCSLDEAVKYALELVEGSALNYGITIEREIPLEAAINVPFHAAANTLAIVIDNAKDAIRHEKKGKGMIQIKVRETEDKFICDITDSGPGIPPEVEKKMLKGVCKSDKPNSHGVGLYFSVSLLQTYNGDIILTHRGPEPNTTFSIIFPK